jgi:hypothetical protein
MDLQDRDESKRRREESLAKRLGQALDEMDARNAGHCPDGEILAAYAERALGLSETEKWEIHFSTCARCRKILMVLAASQDTPLAEKEVAHLGELVASARGPVATAGKSAGRSRPWCENWRMRWLAPAFGAAAVLAVWFAIRPPWHSMDRSAPQILVAEAPKQDAPSSPAPAQADRLSEVAPQRKEAAQAAPPSERASGSPAALNAPVEGLKKAPADLNNAWDKLSTSVSAATDSLQQKIIPNPSMAERENQPSVISPVPPSPEKVQAEAAGEAPAAATQSETKAAPVAPAPSPQLAARARSIQGFAAFKPAEPAFIQATAPYGSTVWRFGKGGRIERSGDSGETWVAQTSPIREDWIAGVAVSDTVCWTAGKNGSIARTTDGERWERVAPPAMSAGADSKLPDWTGITARDAQSATITASDARKFSTADGGKTWQPQP